MLRQIGYWSKDKKCRDGLIHPSLLDNHNFSKVEKAQILRYLRSGVEVGSYLGFSFCRMPDGPSDREMGCRELSDGTYVWPEGYAVYLDLYDIELPSAFVHHVRANSCEVPQDIEVSEIKRDWEQQGADCSYWRRWCAKRVPKRAWWSFG